MDVESLREHLSSLSIPKNHLTLGLTNLIQQSKSLSTLLKHKKLPEHPFTDLQIQSILITLSTLDTNREFTLNNHHSSGSGTAERWVGVGEREGRIYSSLVSSRNYGFGHGMGRSGDIMEPQPKAVGSSILVQLTKALVMDCMKRGAGLKGGDKDGGGPVSCGIVLPVCTGMSVALILSSLRKHVQADEDTDEDHPQPLQDVVLWSRIDQKSCFKAVLSAGFRCIVIPTRTEGDSVVTDMDALRHNMNTYRGRVLAVISTTSCFAPRVPDQIDEIGKLCSSEDVAHIVNNAYGLQCQATVKLINRACVVGRVDAIVSSTDKNFLVPVGGAIITSPKEDTIQAISKTYAGRASSAPILDLFITMLSMGLNGYKNLLEERRMLMVEFQSTFQQIAAKHGERSLSCPKNTISYGITLNSLSQSIEGELPDQIGREMTSLFGSMLFTRCVSGTRVVAKGGAKTISGQNFVGFGSSTDDYPHSYLTAACAIGLTKDEMKEFFNRLDKCFKDFWTKRRKQVKKKAKQELVEQEGITQS